MTNSFHKISAQRHVAIESQRLGGLVFYDYMYRNGNDCDLYATPYGTDWINSTFGKDACNTVLAIDFKDPTISDADLDEMERSLARLSEIRMILFYRDSHVTDDRLIRLQKSMPQCRIWRMGADQPEISVLVEQSGTDAAVAP